ncbi:hypothetical protein [Natrarchaeobius chitinivorans]|nr:hypothetical protein [Natrarchaeobius chitinivorans]
MCQSVFVPVSELYGVSSGTSVSHPANQAVDAEVRKAVERGGSS